MAEPRLMMFKLVTGEQIIAWVEPQREVSCWKLIKPRLVIDRWTGMQNPLVGAPWVTGLKEEYDIPLEFQHAVLTFYVEDISMSLQEQYANAITRP